MGARPRPRRRAPPAGSASGSMDAREQRRRRPPTTARRSGRVAALCPRAGAARPRARCTNVEQERERGVAVATSSSPSAVEGRAARARTWPSGPGPSGGRAVETRGRPRDARTYSARLASRAGPRDALAPAAAAGHGSARHLRRRARSSIRSSSSALPGHVACRASSPTTPSRAASAPHRHGRRDRRASAMRDRGGDDPRRPSSARSRTARRARLRRRATAARACAPGRRPLCPRD